MRINYEAFTLLDDIIFFYVSAFLVSSGLSVFFILAIVLPILKSTFLSLIINSSKDSITKRSPLIYVQRWRSLNIILQHLLELS
mgnify:CR=1 FL=1